MDISHLLLNEVKVSTESRESFLGLSLDRV